ncbi:MAG: hypothetical protein JKY92_03185 [Magnetovibrio sp.]|nr:hypothetical protein [Magnetovibrio sp.]
MPVSLILDVIIAVLLVLTIAYAVRLNQRLLQLRSDKNELLVLAKTFAAATVRAEKAIENLKVTSESLTIEIVKAETLKDDLAYLVNRGGRTADEMVDTVRGGHASPTAPSPVKSGVRDKKFNDINEETRLIEEAIRAATPGPGDDEAPSPPEKTRRIPGKSRGKPKRSGASSSPPRGSGSASPRGSGPASSRGSGPASSRGSGPVSSRGSGPISNEPFPQASSSRSTDMMDDDDSEAIGDTPAARELLKALGSVK